eukprot:366565-Chlamydomonas_euryale.AAC.21
MAAEAEVARPAERGQGRVKLTPPSQQDAPERPSAFRSDSSSTRAKARLVPLAPLDIAQVSGGAAIPKGRRSRAPGVCAVAWSPGRVAWDGRETWMWDSTRI